MKPAWAERIGKALRGDYEASDRLAVTELESEGAVDVLSRGTTLAVIPHREDEAADPHW